MSRTNALFTIGQEDWSHTVERSGEGLRVVEYLDDGIKVWLEGSFEVVLRELVRDLMSDIYFEPVDLAIPEGSAWTMETLFAQLASVVDTVYSSGGFDTLMMPELAPIRFEGVAYIPALREDGSCTWIANRGGHRVIAMFSYSELASMTSGLWRHFVGRLASGEVFLLDELDEYGTSLRVLDGVMSDVEAVRYWFDAVKVDLDFVRRAFKVAYGEGRIVESAADVDPDESETAEIGHELHLTADEIAALCDS